MEQQRKSKRTTAGNLPSRYRDDPSPEPQPSFARPKRRIHLSLMAPHLLASSPQVATPQQARPRGRPRGRPSTRKKPETSEEPSLTKLDYADVQILKEAAFPSLEPGFAEDDDNMTTRGSDKIAQDVKRASMDDSIPSKSSNEPLPRRRNSTSGLSERQCFFRDGHWLDRAGNTLHLLARYYDQRIQQYENEAKDSQGDSKDRNMAFRLFLDSPDGQAAMQLGGKDAMQVEFRKLCASGAAASMMEKAGVNYDEQKKSGDFKDKKFAALHFKLQWCMIQEIEEDLARYPPRNAIAPHDNGRKSYRYARRILGIGSVNAVHGIEKEVQAAMNQQQSLPDEEDYAKAQKYLKDKKLPVTLIEIYNYLE